MRIITAVLSFLLVIASTLPSYAKKTRPDIDPILRGTWIVHMVSYDKGKTIKKVKPFIFCRTHAKHVVLKSGKKLKVWKVIIDRDAKGHPMNLVIFDNYVAWAITKPPGQIPIMVQVLDTANKMAEKGRVLVRIKR